MPLRKQAEELIQLLEQLPMVRKCTLSGSLANGTADELSDIDLEADVSGYDKGRFMLELPELLRDHFNICYFDFAASLFPQKCIVSMALDAQNPYLVADINICAEPSCTQMTAEQVRQFNNPYAHLIKLWTANWKHWYRGRDCRHDILHMVQKTGISHAESKTDLSLLAETLRWLEEHADERYQAILSSCRRVFDQHTARS